MKKETVKQVVDKIENPNQIIKIRDGFIMNFTNNVNIPVRIMIGTLELHVYPKVFYLVTGKAMAIERNPLRRAFNKVRRYWKSHACNKKRAAKNPSTG